jgi:hypothetical protein
MIANKCPDCGTETPLDGSTSKAYKEEIGIITYRCEDIFCGNCGAEIGGFANPQV